MKKISILLLILAVTVLAGVFLLSTQAQAAGDVISGTCGDNLTWTLDDSGTLTISGSGAMSVYSSAPSVSWYNYRSSVKNVVIDNGVTSIGNYAFCRCTALTSITIPNSVTRIGSYAFNGCKKLANITIPDSVTNIGSSAFGGCTGLTEITVPFIGNSKEASTGTYDSHFGYIFGTSSYTGGAATTLGYLSSGSSVRTRTYYIPKSLKWVTVTGDEIPAFGLCGCSNLTGITITNSVTNIGEYAFRNCTGLTNITIPDSVTSFGQYAFYGCTKLATAKIGSKVIGYSAFRDCANLTSITISNGVTSIGSYAFENCTSLTNIAIPSSVINIGNHAFDECTGLANITIPDSVTSIGEYAFDGTAYYNDTDNWQNGVLYIDNHLIKAETSVAGNYEIKAGTRSISGFAFSDCASLTSITIPDSVTSVNACAFYNCTSLTSITIPDSVTSIGGDAFNGTAYYYDKDNWQDGVLYIDNHLIKAATSVSGGYEIKAGTRCIAASAFSGCTGLTSITIPDSVTSIGKSVFYSCSELARITLPKGIDRIEENAFYGCKNIEKVFHKGSQEDWDCILIDSGNDALKSATIYHNYNGTLPGDFNADYEANDADAIFLLRHTLFPERYPVTLDADVNADGIVNDMDALYLLRHFLFPEHYPMYPR